MRRDFIFFIRGIPAELCIRDANYFLMPISTEFQAHWLELSKKLKLESWTQPSQKLLVAVVRNCAESAKEGFDRSYDLLSSLIDGYSILVEGSDFAICPLVQIREADQPNASIKLITIKQGQIQVSSSDGKAEERWNRRTRELLQRMLPLFDTLATTEQSELSEQLRLSAKMFRHGAMASGIGIEFLCKFSALEGLVCGAETEGKKKLLTTRLPTLLGQSHLKAKIENLWNSRCEASHQSKAFTDKFVQAVADVDFLFRCVMIFAADNLGTVKTISQLWSLTPNYRLPPEVTMERETLCGRITKSMVGDRTELVGRWTND